jgi:hypothetical protein
MRDTGVKVFLGGKILKTNLPGKEIGVTRFSLGWEVKVGEDQKMNYLFQRSLLQICGVRIYSRLKVPCKITPA